MTERDGVPTFRQEGERFHAEWGARLPVLEIGRDGVLSSVLRDAPRWLDRVALQRLRSAIVIGERHAGRLASLRWITEHLPADMPGVLIPGTGRPLIWSPRAPAKLRRGVESAIEPLNRTHGRDLEAFEAGSATLFKSPVVLLVDLSGNAERVQAEQQVVARLRALHESSAGAIRLVVGTAWWSMVDQTNLESDLVNLSSVWSVPPWAKSTVARLAEAFQGVPRWEDNDLDTLVEATGGQPALIENALRDVAAAGSGLFRERLAAALDRQRRYPPAAVSIWKAQLRALLKAPELARAVREYVEAPLRADAQGRLSRDLPLVASGWLGFDASGRCGIRSDLHRAWARDVLVGGPK